MSENNVLNDNKEQIRSDAWLALRQKFISKGFIKAYAAKLKQLSEVFKQDDPEEAARAKIYFDQYRVVIGIIESWDELCAMDAENPVDCEEKSE